MRNPRDLIIRASDFAGFEHPVDYFPYSFPLETGSSDKVLVNKLAKVLKDGRNGTREMNNAYAIFKNWSNRIFLEGMLVYFSLDELASMQSFSRGTLQAYVDYFFHVEDLKEFDNRLIFVNLISNDDARNWFLECSTREFEDIKFRLTGKSRKDSKMKETMERVFFKVSSISESFLNLTPDTIQSFKSGLETPQKFLFEIGLKSADISHKIYNTLSAQEDDNKDEEEFIKSWESHVKTLDSSVFDIESPGQEDDILRLMNEVNPLKSADTPAPNSEEEI